MDFEEDVFDLLTTEIVKAFPNSSSEAGLDLELLDMAFDSYGSPIVLYRFLS